MQTKVIVFEGKPGTGPALEPNPEPFGGEEADSAPEAPAEAPKTPAEGTGTADPNPPKRKPGRPRKTAPEGAQANNNNSQGNHA